MILKAEKYNPGEAKKIRKQGKVPAVIYGHNRKTQNIFVDLQEFKKAFRKVGYSTLIEINFEKEKTPTLIHMIDLDPVSNEVFHIDFYAVNMDEPVHAKVVVNFLGNSDAVKLLGGTLMKQHEQIEIKCLPKFLTSSVDVDLSVLKTFHDTIKVGNLTFPSDIEVLDDPDVVVATVSAPKAEEVEKEAESKENEDKDVEKSQEEKEEKKPEK